MTGIQYNPESLQGMRENLERILKFMVTKRIKMHPITSREILQGNLKAVMRLILALAAHYKPQSVRHHDASEYHSLNSQQKTKSGGKKGKKINSSGKFDLTPFLYTHATIPQETSSFLYQLQFAAILPSSPSSSPFFSHRAGN